MHGPTFMANPLACAVALSSLELLTNGDWRGRVRASKPVLTGLEPLRDRAWVKDVRVLGAIGVVQLEHDVDIASATTAAVERGVWLRPFRDLVYVMPPYVIEEEDLASVTDAMTRAVDAQRPG